MCLRLSAWPSSSISPDRALTAVQRPLSMCQQTVNPVEVLSDNPSCCSFLWILLIRLSLHPSPPNFLLSLYLSSANQSNPSFKFHCWLQLPKAHPLFHLSFFVIIPAHSTLHHHTLQSTTLQCRILTSLAAPAAMSNGTSNITSILCNPPYNGF